MQRAHKCVLVLSRELRAFEPNRQPVAIVHQERHRFADEPICLLVGVAAATRRAPGRRARQVGCRRSIPLTLAAFPLWCRHRPIADRGPAHQRLWFVTWARNLQGVSDGPSAMPNLRLRQTISARPFHSRRPNFAVTRLSLAPRGEYFIG